MVPLAKHGQSIARPSSPQASHGLCIWHCSIVSKRTQPSALRRPQPSMISSWAHLGIPIVTSHATALAWWCHWPSTSIVYGKPEQPPSLPRSKPLALLCSQRCTVTFNIAPPLAKHESPNGTLRHPMVTSHARPWHCGATGQARTVHMTPKQPPSFPCSMPPALPCRPP